MKRRLRSLTWRTIGRKLRFVFGPRKETSPFRVKYARNCASFFPGRLESRETVSRNWLGLNGTPQRRSIGHLRLSLSLSLSFASSSYLLGTTTWPRAENKARAARLARARVSKRDNDDGTTQSGFARNLLAVSEEFLSPRFYVTNSRGSRAFFHGTLAVRRRERNERVS